jgi:hypothetical protein
MVSEELTDEWIGVLRDPAGFLENPNTKKENLAAEINIKADFIYEGKMTPDRLKKMHEELGEVIQKYAVEKVFLNSWLEK